MAHHIHHLLREFKVGLEAEVASRRTLEQEAEINVDDVALLIQHYIPVVSVFDLEEEAEDAVGGHALDEIPSGRLEALAALLPVFGDLCGETTSSLFQSLADINDATTATQTYEVFEEPEIGLSPELIARP